MDNKELIEGNCLIAEFFGYIKSSSDNDFTFYEHPDGKGIVIQSEYDYNKFIQHGLAESRSFIFHRSWDWLMPIICKIELLFEGAICIDVRNIENTFNQVVKFIKWYNKQNINP